MTAPPRQTWRLRLAGALPLALAGSLLLFILGARWGWIDRFGSDLPNWDQWDAEGVHLLAPWRENQPMLRQFFLPHNEHRVVLTKLLNLALTAVNGCWDQRLECVVNAMLPAVLAAVLFLWSHRFCSPRILPLIWLLLAAGWALPLAWQNILGGFHSQQFFLLGLSCGTIILLPVAPVWSPRWWLGSACAVLALGSMASGLLAAAVAGALATWRLLRGEARRRDAVPTMGIAAAIVLLGVLTRVEVPYHAGIKAHSLHDFLLTCWHSLHWPIPPAGEVLGGLIWVPWLWLGWVEFRRARGTGSSHGQILVGLGGWALLHIVLTAYARGAGGSTPASRYVDTLVFGALVNALTLAWLSRTLGSPSPRWRTILLISLTVGWLGAGFWGTVYHSQRALSEMIEAAREIRAAEVNVARHLATGDDRLLQTGPIPYPARVAFASYLQRPSLRELLPASVRPSLNLSAERTRGFRQATTNATDALPSGFPPSPTAAFLTSWNPIRREAKNAEWTSQKQWATARWLRFAVAGAGPQVELEIRDGLTQVVLGRFEPQQNAADQWTRLHVYAPAHGFVVAAKVAHGRGWLAFSGPVEVTTLSYLGFRAAQFGWCLAGIAAALAATLGGLSLLPACSTRFD